MSPWDALLVAAKALTYGSTLAAAGGIAFLDYNHAELGRSGSALRRWVAWLVGMAVIASIAKIAVAAGSLSGDASGMLDRQFTGMILGGGEGRATGIRLAALALCLTALGGSRPAAAARVGAAAAATSFAWVGHAHASAFGWWAILALGVHLAAVAFWLGALVPLLLIAAGGDLAQLARSTARFGAAALRVVALLAVAGALLLAMLLAGSGASPGGAYVRLIITKLVLFGVLLALAAANHWRLTPRLLAGDGHAGTALRRSIHGEIALAGSILIVTAALTTLTGPSAAD